jgi:hypothetical protein
MNNPFTGTQNQTVINTPMGDKEHVFDSLQAQKKVSEGYNTFASECVNANLKNDFINILKDEQQIEYELFQELQNRGWYQVQQAPQAQIDQAKQKFSNM